MTRKRKPSADGNGNGNGTVAVEENDRTEVQPERGQQTEAPATKQRMGRGANPNRNYRIVGPPADGRDLPEVYGSKSTVGQARKLLAVLRDLPVMRGVELWVERCVRVSDAAPPARG